MAAPNSPWRVADRLLADGRITAADHARAIDHARQRGARVEDALVELAIVAEVELLKYLAKLHETRFVSTDKLSKAAIDERVLAKVTRDVAEARGVFPVLYDETSQTLSVVTADPDDGAGLREVRLAGSSVRVVSPLVARPAAIRAAILQHYGGDPSAFAALTSGPVPAQPPSKSPTKSAPAASTPALAPAAAPLAPAPVAQAGEFLEALNVLVTLLEQSRQDLRGHSAAVARLTRRICERLGLPATQVAALTAAAYVHDLGKMGAYHLTAWNVAEYDGHRAAALKAYELPAQLMASVGLLPDTVAAVTGMYERYDGKGFPKGLSDKEIPIGARILAVTDTYADLTQNPRNPLRKILPPVQACELLDQHRGTLFDPDIVDVFRTAMTGDELRQRLRGERHRVLIVDDDPDHTGVLELRMLEQGYEVRIATTLAQARRDLAAAEISLVVSEIDLDEPDAGLTLRTEALEAGNARDACWVMLTRKVDRQSKARAFDLGVDDVVHKPVAPDAFVIRLRQLLERKATRTGGAGVSGSLAEMPLPDVVQILWYGRKTGALKIKAHAGRGEIHFADGDIYNAQWNALRGEEAFYEMLVLREGEFRLDPSFKPNVRSITASPESLLLEVMRRLDERPTAPA